MMNFPDLPLQGFRFCLAVFRELSAAVINSHIGSGQKVVFSPLNKAINEKSGERTFFKIRGENKIRTALEN